MPVENVITAHELSKSFKSGHGTVEAVRSVSIDVEQGEIFGFLGPNGAGKTTILRMLTTLLPIDAGRATVAGFDVAREPNQVRSRIGYVSQLGGADELASGRENLILQGRLYGGRLARVKPRVDTLIEQLDLGGFADRRVKTYSGGQRRRLDVALGVVHEPAVLFLDEPTTGLDPRSRASLWACVRDLRDGGTTVFLTTHYLEEADVLCDRLMIIDHGQIVAVGTPRDLKREVLGDAIAIALRQDGQDTERALPLLRQQPYVRELATHDGKVRLYVDDADTIVPELIRLLDKADIGVRSITLSEPSLDDVFLRKTGRSLSDADTPPGPADDTSATQGKAAR
ncbi:MAG: ATP-binding cassette domain-containing protein [Actinomycetota bacterium]|nr:ATP-binding cassette domain-containing protein [Actinomycetota bacterium]